MPSFFDLGMMVVGVGVLWIEREAAKWLMSMTYLLAIQREWQEDKK